MNVTVPTSSGGQTLDLHHNGHVSRRQWSFKTDEEGKKVFVFDHESNAGTLKNGVLVAPPRPKTKRRARSDKTELVGASEAAGPAGFELAHGDIVSTAGVLHAVVDLDGSLAHLKDPEKFREYLEEKVRSKAH